VTVTLLRKLATEVAIDNKDVATVDCYSAATSAQQALFQKTDLTTGTHTIRITVTGQKNSKSAAFYVDVDRFEVPTPVMPAVSLVKVEDPDKYLNFKGSWSAISGSSFSGSTMKTSNSTGAYAELTFTGSSVKWIGLKNPNRGIAKVTIDNKDVATVDCYSAATSAQQALFQKTDLTTGTHTIRITVTGQKNSKSAAFYVDVDRFEVPTPVMY
jgi:predicted carbohydrate-binding protein with CBM5 and CBM33 domain